MVSRETEEHIAEEAVEGGIAILLWEGFTRGVKYVWRHWLGPQLQKHSDVVIEGARQKVAEKINDDRREELLELFMQLPPADRVNLMRWHLAAMNGEARISENTFASLLLKIPVEKREARLKWLNSLSDGEFWQMMYLQEHDPVHQWLEQLKRKRSDLDGSLAAALEIHRQKVEQSSWVRPWELPVIGFFIDPPRAIVYHLKRYAPVWRRFWARTSEALTALAAAFEKRRAARIALKRQEKAEKWAVKMTERAEKRRHKEVLAAHRSAEAQARAAEKRAEAQARAEERQAAAEKRAAEQAAARTSQPAVSEEPITPAPQQKTSSLFRRILPRRK